VLVVLASHAGLPVSTTHVSVRAVFGIGTVNRSADRKTIFTIAGAWLVTLPAGALIGAVACWVLER
jgi:PiT family inorganic phosphate transporter